MAIVDWALICDLAYFDRGGRLCMLGIEHAGSTRATGRYRLTIVVRLLNRGIDVDLDPALFVTSPTGDWRVAGEGRDFRVESRGDYVLVHMPGVALHEEGVHRFEVALGTSEPTVFDLSMLITASRSRPLHSDGVM